MGCPHDPAHSTHLRRRQLRRRPLGPRPGRLLPRLARPLAGGFQIPADKAEYAAFTTLHDTAQEQLRDIITELAESQPDPGSVAGKLAALYASYLDTERRDELGVRPLAEELAQIDALTSVDQLGALFGAWDRAGLGGPLGTYVHQDNMDSSRYLLDVWQSGSASRIATTTWTTSSPTSWRTTAPMWRTCGSSPGSVTPRPPPTLRTGSWLWRPRWQRRSGTKVRNRDPRRPQPGVAGGVRRPTGGLDSDAFLAGVGVSVELGDLNLAQPGYLTELGG